MVFSSLKFLYATIKQFLAPESVQIQFSLNVRDGNLFYIYDTMNTSFIAKMIKNTNEYIVNKYISNFYFAIKTKVP